MITDAHKLGDYRLDPPNDDFEERLGRWILANCDALDEVLDLLGELEQSAQDEDWDMPEFRLAASEVCSVIRPLYPGFNRNDRIAHKEAANEQRVASQRTV